MALIININNTNTHFVKKSREASKQLAKWAYASMGIHAC